MTCYEPQSRRKTNMPNRRVTRSTGVTLELVVLDYLRELAESEHRDRSFCINEIVREHAERNGRPLPPPNPNSSPQDSPEQ